MKTNEEIAREVINGNWGNGEARRSALANAGYSYSDVQGIVDQMVNGTYNGSGASGNNGSDVKPDTSTPSSSYATQGSYGSYQYGKMPTYSSKYTAQIEQATKLLDNYPAYQSQYQPQLNNLQNQIANDKFQSKWMPTIEGLADQISNYGDYNSKYQPAIDNYVNKLTGEADLSGDAMMQNYKDLYTRGGQQAMLDTQAAAAALTGGYGSSYGQSVGQQAYNSYMADLASRMPELYQTATDMWTSKLNTLNGLDETDYGRWRDRLGDLYNEQGMYQGMDDTDYGRWRDSHNDLYNQYDMLDNADTKDYGRYMDQYGMDQDKLNMYLNLDETDYNRMQAEYAAYAEAYAQQEALRAAEAAAAAGSSGGSGGGRSGNSNNGSDNTIRTSALPVYIDRRSARTDMMKDFSDPRVMSGDSYGFDKWLDIYLNSGLTEQEFIEDFNNIW